MRAFHAAVIVGSLVVWMGCAVAGPCLHEYEDPVLEITEVRGDGVPLDVVTLSNVMLNGRAASDLNRLAASPGFGMTVVDGSLLCQLPCGFGTEEGAYEVLIQATNYQPKQITIPARYSGFDGGCPSRNFGSTKLSVALDAE